MGNQTLKFYTAGGLLVFGMIVGVQIGKSEASSFNSAKAAPAAVMNEAQATATASAAPFDYFPAQYVNNAKSVEPLPPQF